MFNARQIITGSCQSASFSGHQAAALNVCIEAITSKGNVYKYPPFCLRNCNILPKTLFFYQMSQTPSNLLYPCERGCSRKFLSLNERRNHYRKNHMEKKKPRHEQQHTVDDVEMEEAHG